MLSSRIRAFEASASAANDPKVMASKISEFSDRKKYNFVTGMKNDLMNTRAALRKCAAEHPPGPIGSDKLNEASKSSLSKLVSFSKRASNSVPRESADRCTFGALYEYSAGQIANLNKILTNLKKAGEVSFQVEIFFQGQHDDEEIVLLAKFWDEAYTVDADNVFRPGRNERDIPEEERKGRSYVTDNLATRDQTICTTCGDQVESVFRVTIRGKVYHSTCIKCSVCGASPRENADFVTFDGKICCSTSCVANYDAAHVNQRRG